MDEEADALFARITGTSAATSAPIARTSAASATPIAPGVGVELPRPDQGRYLPINDNGIQFPELPPLIAFSPAGWERTPESPITAVLGVPVLDSEFAEAVGNLARLEGKSDGLLAMAAQMRHAGNPNGEMLALREYVSAMHGHRQAHLCCLAIAYRVARELGLPPGATVAAITPVGFRYARRCEPLIADPAQQQPIDTGGLGVTASQDPSARQASDDPFAGDLDKSRIVN